MKHSGLHRSYLFGLIAAMLFTCTMLHGQIYSNAANISKTVKYNSYDGSDRLFVFYQKEGKFKAGSLSVNGIGAGNFDFEWTKYNHLTDGFTDPVKIDPGLPNSTISGLGDGGYQVRITNGVDVDTIFVAWLMLDDFYVSTEDDGAGNVKWGKSGCPDGDNYLYLDGIVEADSFFYYDPVTHDSIRYINGYTFEWTTNNTEVQIYNAKRFLTLQNQVLPFPVEDSYFILTATDSLGMKEIDSVFYATKFTRAAFSLSYYDKVTKDFNPDLTESWSLDAGSLDAPLLVRFINESKNGAEFTWVLLDTINELTGEANKVEEYATDFDYEPEFTYENADKYYYPYMVSISEEGCIDTFRIEDGIRVVPSDLAIPNVFSPNDDGQNDVFLFKHQSIKQCKLTIIDKFGRVVYKRDIEDIYLWEGWRGTILNSDRPAPEGQYYYIVEGIGYDNVPYKDPNFFEQRKINKQSSNNTPPSGTDPGQSNITTIYTGWLYLFRNSGSY